MRALSRDSFVYLIGDRTEQIDGEEKHPYFLVPLYQYKIKKGYISDKMIEQMGLYTTPQGDRIFATVAAGRVEFGLDYPDGLPESEVKLAAALD